jgi:soluble lytic murein transglycosylase-like protein
MKFRPILRRNPPTRPTLRLMTVAVLAAVCLPAFAAEHITLRNGAEFDCLRREPAGDRVRLYLVPSAAPPANDAANYVEVPAASVLRVETIPDPPPPAPTSLLSSRSAPLLLSRSAPLLSSSSAAEGSASPAPKPLTPTEMRQLLARAGTAHNIDADLLASVVQAESAGNVLAVSRAGAQGLMQLMPSTASSLNVHNTFAPEDNISGGTAYLDQLLTRYRDNIALALAAYNAGPAAVDRYHGIPPYAETRAYVACVIRAFNRRKLAAASLAVVTNAH